MLLAATAVRTDQSPLAFIGWFRSGPRSPGARPAPSLPLDAHRNALVVGQAARSERGPGSAFAIVLELNEPASPGTNDAGGQGE